MEGVITSCLIEKGKNIQMVDEASDDNLSESEFDNDFEDQSDNEDESDIEAYEVRAESVNSQLSRNTTIIIFIF